VVFYEHYYPTPNQHMHIQVIPFPNRERNRAKDLFINEGKKHKLNWSTLESKQTIRHDVSAKDNFFWVKLPDGKQLISTFDTLPFSFGRRVLCYLWGNPGLEDWKSCVLPKQQEDKITKELREVLPPYLSFITSSK